jgi:hypothetical protein
MSNVTYISTSLDIPADRILESAIGKLEGVVLIGITKDDEEYFAVSYGAGPMPIWLIERFKTEYLKKPKSQ